MFSTSCANVIIKSRTTSLDSGFAVWKPNIHTMAIPDTIFLLQNDNILTDVQNVTTNDMYTVMLRKTNKDVLCQAKWEKVFGDKINWKNIWKTIHSCVIDYWDFNIIYKLIHKVIAVRKHVYHWMIVPTPECLGCSHLDTVLQAVLKPKQKIIKQVEPIFKKRFGDNFKLNVYIIIFRPNI